MFDLIQSMAATPEAQQDAHYWASVLLAHALVGLTLCGALAALVERADDWIDNPRWMGWWLGTGGYFALWEVAVQHLGAGMGDALVDTAGVSLGGAAGLLAWSNRGRAVAAVLGLLSILAAVGVWRRRK